MMQEALHHSRQLRPPGVRPTQRNGVTRLFGLVFKCHYQIEISSLRCLRHLVGNKASEWNLSSLELPPSTRTVTTTKAMYVLEA
jgi:hypothetical protein